MKKGTVLNSDISSVISRLGHTDTLVVCDAGLPIPKSTTRIDMALTQGVPSFMQVLGVVTNEMQVEAAIIAEEIKQHNPQLHETLLTHLSSCKNTREIPLKFVTPRMNNSNNKPQKVRRYSQRRMFSVCEYHSLCWRDVLRPSWKHYFSLKASIKPSRA